MIVNPPARDHKLTFVGKRLDTAFLRGNILLIAQADMAAGPQLRAGGQICTVVSYDYLVAAADI